MATYFVTDEASGDELEVLLCSSPEDAAREMCSGYSADSDSPVFTVRDESGKVLGSFKGRATVTWRMEPV